MKERPYLKALFIWGVTAAIAFFSAKFGIVIPPPPQPPPTVTPPSQLPPAEPGPDVQHAIGRIQFGNSGCTATPIGKKRADGRYLLVTASHCVSSVGQQGRFISQHGDRIAVSVIAIDRRSDCAWLATDTTTVVLPYAELADDLPAGGSKVWHAGYGVDKPGNTEHGEFVDGPHPDGKLRFNIAVSSGDSGGAIVTTANGRVLSVVCCAANAPHKGVVFGAGPASIRRLLEGAPVADEWTPVPIPKIGDIPEKMPE